MPIIIIKLQVIYYFIPFPHFVFLLFKMFPPPQND